MTNFNQKSNNDYTSKEIEIEIVLKNGYSSENAVHDLYTYTDCQTSISLSPMVFCDDKLVRMSIPQILKRNTDKLLEYLGMELKTAGKNIDMAELKIYAIKHLRKTIKKYGIHYPRRSKITEHHFM